MNDRELREKLFVDRNPETVEEKLSYAMAILEIYADATNWEANRDRRLGTHRLGERIVLKTHNIVPGWSFAKEVIDRINGAARPVPTRKTWLELFVNWASFGRLSFTAKQI